MPMRILVLACLFALAVLAPGRADAQAAATLSGRVTDASGRPLADVSVAVTELRRGTTTGADGRYAISSLPEGVYRVSFQRLGYAPSVQRVELRAVPAPLDVALVLSALELPGTQVTASAKATTALTSPQPTSVLEGEALRQSLAPSLGATLEQLPGLRSWSTGAGIGKPSIRGLRSDRVLVASDGVRLDNQQWGDEHGAQVETADIERIEVIRGPASVLYGSDALGGVVNVIPRELPTAFEGGPFLRARVHGGYASGDDNREGGLAVEGARRGLGWRGSITGRTSGDVGTPGGRLFNSGNEDVTAGAAVGLRGARGSLDLSYVHRDERVEIHEDPAEDPAATPYQRIGDDLARLRAILPVGGRSRLEVNLGGGQNRRREFEAADDPAVALGLAARSLGGVARFHHPALGSFEGLVGLSWAANRFRKFGAESLIPASDGSDVAVFAFEQTETGPWRLALGARYDHRTLEVDDDADLGVVAQERAWDALTGNLGALYRVAGPVALVANLGRGFRAPSNFDLFSNGVHEGTVAFERGNPDLRVETSLNADLAVRVQSSRVRAEIGAFVNEIDDYIYTRPTGAIDPGSGFEIFETVQGNARLVGFEASAEAHPSRHLHVSASTDFVRGENTETDRPLPWIPPLRVLYGVRIEPDPIGGLEDLYVGLRGESVTAQTRLDTFDTGVPAYTLAHAEAGITIPVGGRSVIVDLGVRNLFDTSHRDFMSRYKAYALAPGRSLTVRVTTRL